MSLMRIDASPDGPFGAHRASNHVEAIRALGPQLPANGFGRLAASALRRVCFATSAPPYDVEVFPAVFARLRPATNRTEKRVFLAPQFWDGAERAALETLLIATDPAEPFVFVDVGANVGFYGLSLASVARAEGRSLRVVAIEPDPTNRARLETNIGASGLAAAFAVEPVAVGRTSGVARLIQDAKNRGEVRVAGDVGEGVEVRVDTLNDILLRNGLTTVDAMKVDVEGMDYEVLAGFFEQAEASLWPRLLIVELGRGEGPSPLLDLLAGNGYRLETRTKLNAVMVRGPSS